MGSWIIIRGSLMLPYRYHPGKFSLLESFVKKFTFRIQARAYALLMNIAINPWTRLRSSRLYFGYVFLLEIDSTPNYTQPI